jgi:hypothetical protein
MQRQGVAAGLQAIPAVLLVAIVVARNPGDADPALGGVDRVQPLLEGALFRVQINVADK